jgi:choline-phosphate cytidylyltransferase
MTKVITYGTYDLLHYGHIRLLERAKRLGDFLIVGVTSEDFDKTRGKINVQQTLEERVEALRQTGIADTIIIEEYEGQKIDDIKKYGVDIFAIGSDWVGYFDYLEEYCQVVYLDRTEGISSTDIRARNRSLSLGLVGYSGYLNKVFHESSYVNGAKITSLCCSNRRSLSAELLAVDHVTDDYGQFLDTVDAVYVHSHPRLHCQEVRQALEAGKHVLCESPVAMAEGQCLELFNLAQSKGLVLMESLRTAYSTAYARLLLLLKGGKIGDVVSVDATCTSLSTNAAMSNREDMWGSMTSWGPTALLPVFQILGTHYRSIAITTKRDPEDEEMDVFSKIDLLYPRAVASVKVGTGVKSEGELIVSGTKGYVYVPAPWWKTDYFEIRYEDPTENKRYFYKLDGEGIRLELVAFLKAINATADGTAGTVGFVEQIDGRVTAAIAQIMEVFTTGEHTRYL